MADRVTPSRHWWVRRRGSIGAAVVVVAILAGGAAAWAADGSGNSGYRMTTVVRASVSNSLTVTGSLAPVSDASAAFQVAGKVATVTAAVGQTVTAGESLATLDPTALTESVSSAQSALESDQAKLTEDEDSETASASSTTTTTTTTTPARSSTTTTMPTGLNGSTGSTGSSSQITADQQQLTTDQATTNADQQQEAVDLAQAQTDCGTTTTTTTTSTTTPSTAACTSDLEQVSSDQQKVSADQTTVSHDEATLAKALSTSSSNSSSTGGGVPSGASTASTTTTTAPKAAASSTSRSATGTSGASGQGASADSDTPEQIATDQAAIDSAEATLIDAQQSLAAAQLSSPINGTIVSVGITVGDTVSANSSTEVIVIIGTQSYEVSATLTSAEVQDVKVGDRAEVSVDGINAAIAGTVSQVGPVQYDDEAYTYPVVALLPSSAQGLFSGSTATLTIATGGVDDVVAVPTSAVITNNATSYVETLDKGVLTRKVVKLGMIGSVYSQVRSGLTVGQSVVLADYSEAVPSSNTATLGGGFGGGGFGGGGGGFITRRTVSAGGGVTVSGTGGFGG
jgi:HlyD family secretion protein